MADDLRAALADTPDREITRQCSRPGCPGDGRYVPPGRGHLPGCLHLREHLAPAPEPMPEVRDALAEVILRTHEPGFANVKGSRLRDALLEQFREVADAVLASPALAAYVAEQQAEALESWASIIDADLGDAPNPSSEMRLWYPIFASRARARAAILRGGTQ